MLRYNVEPKTFSKITKWLAKQSDLQISYFAAACLGYTTPLEITKLLAVCETLHSRVGDKGNFTVYLHFVSKEYETKWREEHKDFLALPWLKGRLMNIEDLQETPEWQKQRALFDQIIGCDPADKVACEISKELKTTLDRDVSDYLKRKNHVETDPNKLYEYYLKLAVDRLFWMPDLSQQVKYHSAFLSLDETRDQPRIYKVLDKLVNNYPGKFGKDINRFASLKAEVTSIGPASSTEQVAQASVLENEQSSVSGSLSDSPQVKSPKKSGILNGSRLKFIATSIAAYIDNGEYEMARTLLDLHINRIKAQYQDDTDLKLSNNRSSMFYRDPSYNNSRGRYSPLTTEMDRDVPSTNFLKVVN